MFYLIGFLLSIVLGVIIFRYGQWDYFNKKRYFTVQTIKVKHITIIILVAIGSWFTVVLWILLGIGVLITALFDYLDKNGIWEKKVF